MEYIAAPKCCENYAGTWFLECREKVAHKSLMMIANEKTEFEHSFEVNSTRFVVDTRNYSKLIRIEQFSLK